MKYNVWIIAIISSFRSAQESTSLWHLTIELCTTKIESRVFLLKSLKQELLFQIFLLQYIEASMAFEHTSPSNSLLSFMQLYDYLFCIFVLFFLLDIPYWFFGVYYTFKIMFKIRRCIFESDCELFGRNGYFEYRFGFDILR